MMLRRILVVGALLALVATGCGDDDGAATTTAAPPTTTAAATTAPAVTTTAAPVTTEAAPVLLELTGPDGVVELTLADLQALPATEGWAGGKSSTGTITVPEIHRGVALSDLAALVGGLDDGYALSAVAKDGYGITFSFDQAAAGRFIAYDPGSGEETEPDGALTAIVAYERSGAPIPDDADGPLRLAVVSLERDQVVDGHWNVKWVTAIEIVESGLDWVLALSGAADEALDRATFDSCLSCHASEWTDEDGATWSGVPLYLIAGRVDGGEIHGDDAYDRDLAEAGYLLAVTAADGFMGEIPSEAFHLADEVLLASTVDGEPLGDDAAPLRVVGPGLSGRQQVGQVAEIAAVFGDAGDGDAAGNDGAGTVSDQTPPAGATLTVGGAVDEPLDLDAAGLGDFGAIEAVIEHPKNGEQTYIGIPVKDLLDAAGATGATVTIVASDGYSTDVDLADLMACDLCLVAFDGDVLSMALPGFSSSAWVKDVVGLEVG